MPPIHLNLWVSSRCNLHCPHCSQSAAMRLDQSYTMPMSELESFIRSSKRRGIHYATIEITGGEPTLWPILSAGVKMLHESGLCDWLTTVTNGNDADNASRLFKEYMPFYGLSSSQATPEQISFHQEANPGIFLNAHAHKQLPQKPVPDSLPAECCVSTEMTGRKVLPLLYYRERIHHCCNALALGGEALSVPFESDFVEHFTQHPRDHEICSRCVCNGKVWRQI